MSLPRPGIGTIIVVFLGTAWLASDGRQSQGNQDPLPTPVANAAPEGVAAPTAKAYLVGVSGCSSYPCHGGQRRSAIAAVGSEYLYWSLYDPHARAYHVLEEETSLRMLSILVGEMVGRFSEAPDSLQTLCLACHTTAGDLAPAARGETVLADGVSCESCHGPASGWLAAHTQRSWHGLRRAAAANGFVNTDRLNERAGQCARCHVGDATHQVNHDMIAAGHPRLNFELSSFMARLPRHWDRDEQISGSIYGEPAHGQAYEAKAYLVGQCVAASYALKLLSSRIERELQRPGVAAAFMPGQHVWPELSEYSCYACHRDLEASSGIDDARASRIPGPIGSLRWGSWYVHGLLDADGPLAFAAADGGRWNSAVSELQQVREAMDRFYLPDEQLAAVAQQARQLAGEFDRLAVELDTQFTTRVADQAAVNALYDKVKLAVSQTLSWDDACQAYLALRAINRSLDDMRAPRADAHRQQLRLLADELRLKPELNSPQGKSAISLQEFFDASRDRR